jgi:hypothetical protein
MILRQLYGVIVWRPFAIFFGYRYDLLTAEGAVVDAELLTLQCDDFEDVTFKITWAKD